MMRPDEADAFARARAFLSYLPDYAGAPLERVKPKDKPERREEMLLSIVPRDKSKAYNMHKILDAVLDKGSVFEMGRHWGRATITAFARVDGWPVAVLANDPMFLGGSWTADTAEKAKRFVELAELFNLPVINLVDNPGFMIGLEAERTATIRRGVEAMNGIYRATVRGPRSLFAKPTASRARPCPMRNGFPTASPGPAAIGAACPSTAA